MAFDGIVLKSLVYELNNSVIGYKIDKIYQPERDEIVLILRGFRDTKKIFISADSNYPRINLTEKSYVNPNDPPLFCMLLRKHIGSGKIISVTQKGSDRIMKIDISSYNELGDMVTKSIIVEIMGKYSNIILVDERNVIIDSIKHIDFTVSSKRQLLPGLLYESPPLQDKQDVDDYNEDIIRDVLYGDKDINADKFAQNMFNGISPIVSREIAYIAFNRSSEMLLKDDIDKKALYMSKLTSVLNNINNNKFVPVILYDEENMPKYFSVINIEQYENLYSKKYFESISEVIENYYSEIHFKRKLKIRSYELNKLLQNLIDKTKKKIAIHNDTIISSKKREEYKLYGELLSANIYMLKGKEKSIEVYNYYNDENIVIDLKEDLSASGNIERYYRLYKKSKTAEEMALKQLEVAKGELYFLEDELSFLEKASSQADIDDIKDELIKEGYIKRKEQNKKKKKQSKYLSFTSSDGYEILVGKNSRQNDEITFKESKGNDLWFHVKDYHGSHVLVKYKGYDIPEKTIYEAAQYAAFYSGNKNNKIDVDYTKIKYVKKPSGAKPGGVIYTDYNTITVDTKDFVI